MALLQVVDVSRLGQGSILFFRILLEQLLSDCDEDDLLDIVQKLALSKDPLGLKDSVMMFLHTYMGNTHTPSLRSKMKLFMQLLDKVPVLAREASLQAAEKKGSNSKKKKRKGRGGKGGDDYNEPLMWDED